MQYYNAIPFSEWENKMRDKLGYNLQDVLSEEQRQYFDNSFSHIESNREQEEFIEQCRCELEARVIELTINTTTMSKNADYKIKNVTVSTNGRNEIYFDIEWEGDDKLDYFELRIREGGTDNSLELYAYPAHQQRVVVKDFYFVKSWKSKQVNNKTFYVELGIADYTEKGELKSWEVLADYEPIEVGIYYEPHIFRKNILELR